MKHEIVRVCSRDEKEEDFYRAMHYMAGALWVVGAAEQALITLRDVFTEAANSGRPAPERRRP